MTDQPIQNPHKEDFKPIYVEKGKIILETKDVVIIKLGKQKVNTNTDRSEITLDDIRKYCLIRYGSYGNIGTQLGGYSRTWSFRLLNGQKEIKKDKTIIKVATALDIQFETLKKALIREGLFKINKGAI